MFKFKDFIADTLYLEMARRATLRGLDMSVPEPVINILNITPPQFQNHVFQWIFTEGLRTSLVHRRELCDKLSQELGVPIPQDALFNVKAHEQIEPLREIYPTVEKYWFESGLEPDEIVVPHRQVTSRLSLQDMNAYLIRNNQKPLYYGGTEGLIEHIEIGTWNKKQQVDYSEYEKYGHDLSLGDQNPDGLKEDPVTGRWYYAFGLHSDAGFQPPANPTYWAETLQGAREQSRTQIAKIFDMIKQGKSIPHEWAYLKSAIDNSLVSPNEQKELLQHAVGLRTRRAAVATDEPGEDAADDVPVATKSATVNHVTITNPQWYQDIKEAARAVLKKGLQTPRSMPGRSIPELALQPASESNVEIRLTGGWPPNETYAYGTMSDLNKVLNDLMGMIFQDDPGGETGKVKLRIHKRYSDDKVAKKAQSIRGATLIANGANLLGWSDNKKYVAITTYVRNKNKAPTFSHVHPTETVKVELEDLFRDGWSVDEKYIPSGKIEPDTKQLVFTKPGELAPRKVIRQGEDWLETIPQYEQVDLQKVLDDGGAVVPMGKGHIYEVQPKGSVDLVEMMKKGWRIDTSNLPSGKITPDVQLLRLYKGKFTRTLHRDKENWIEQGYHVKAVRGADGVLKWFQVASEQPSNDEELPEFIGTSMTVKANIDLPGAKELEPGDANDLFNNWINNPQMFGDRRGENGLVPKSVESGVYAFAQRKDDHFDDACSDALVRLNSEAGRYQFKWGELSEKTNTIQRLLTEAVPTLANNKSIIPKIIDHMMAFLRSGKNPQSYPVDNDEGGINPLYNELGFRKDVYNAFLKNGYFWRSSVAQNTAKSSYHKAWSEKRQNLGQAEEGDGKKGGKGGAEGIADPRYTTNFLGNKIAGLSVAHGAQYDDEESEQPYVPEDEDVPLSTAKSPEAFQLLIKRARDKNRKRVTGQGGKAITKNVSKAPLGSVKNYIPPPWAKENIIKMPLQEPVVGYPPAAVATAAQQPPFVASTPPTDFAAKIMAQARALRKFGESRFISYKVWQEMTGVVYGYSRKKAHLPDGCGFNIWGEPGRTGVSIGGEVKNKDGKKHGLRPTK